MDKIPDTKQHTRNSLLTHLNTLQSFGMECVFAPENSSLVDSQSNVVEQLSKESSDEPMKKTLNKKAKTLDELQNKVIGDCKRCKLCKGRNNVVFGDGNPHAELMFIGEGPGADEDEQGIPFVGRAGKLLSKIIESMGYTREEIYIANVVKCRPPKNRNPETDEIEQCMPFLMQQIALIKPKAVICLGKFAAQTVLDSKIPISKLRGDFREIDGVQIMPSFHPAYLLRNPAMKRLMWEDCKKVMTLLGKKG
jgi:uracil-DNA glycosylase